MNTWTFRSGSGSEPEEPLPRSDLEQIEVMNCGWFYGLVERINDLMWRLAPLGYEDETGFHYGEPVLTSSWD